MEIKCGPRKHTVVLLECVVGGKDICEERNIGATGVGASVNMDS